MKFDIGLVRLAGALATHSSVRQNLIAENIANADTPSYRARDLHSFQDLYGQDAVGASRMRATKEGHIDHANGEARFSPVERAALGAEAPNGNNVSIEDQIIRSAEVNHAHEMALGVYRTSMDILRTSLGRRG